MTRNELRQMLDKMVGARGYYCVEESCFDGYAELVYDKSGEYPISIGHHIDEVEADNEKGD